MNKTVSILNKEVSQEYINAISTMDWKNVIESVDESRNLLKSVWNMDAENVAKGIQKAHVMACNIYFFCNPFIETVTLNKRRFFQTFFSRKLIG